MAGTCKAVESLSYSTCPAVFKGLHSRHKRVVKVPLGRGSIGWLHKSPLMDEPQPACRATIADQPARHIGLHAGGEASSDWLVKRPKRIEVLQLMLSAWLIPCYSYIDDIQVYSERVHIKLLGSNQCSGVKAQPPGVLSRGSTCLAAVPRNLRNPPWLSLRVWSRPSELSKCQN